MSEESTIATETTTTAPAETTTTESTGISSIPKEPTTPTSNEGGTPAPAAVVPPAYTPNLKFKYFDTKQQKQIEKEFDEWLRPAVKDEKTEKELRDLYERAYGLDPVKDSREKFKSENESLKSEVRDTKKALSVLSSYVQSGDMQSFFESLKIPEEKVLKYVQERLQYRDMSPEQKAQYDSFRTAQQRAAFLQEQNEALEQKFIETQSTQRARELDGALADPNISQVVQAFDERFGAPGSFRDEVIRRGQYYWHQFQKDVPVEQVVNEVVRIAGGMPPTMPVPPAEKAPVVSTPSQVVEKKPIIPNVQSKGTSPAKKIPRSIEDLKKLSQAMA